MDFIEGVANVMSDATIRASENAATTNSIQKLLSDFANNQNPSAIVSLTIQIRRFG